MFICTICGHKAVSDFALEEHFDKCHSPLEDENPHIAEHAEAVMEAGWEAVVARRRQECVA
jgi:hypothetical protein